MARQKIYIVTKNSKTAAKKSLLITKLTKIEILWLAWKKG